MGLSCYNGICLCGRSSAAVEQHVAYMRDVAGHMGELQATSAGGSCHKDVKMFDILTNDGHIRAPPPRHTRLQTSVARNCAPPSTARRQNY